jgi:hypothetical protein
MVMDSYTGIVKESGELILHFTGVTDGVMVMDNFTEIVTESRNLMV